MSDYKGCDNCAYESVSKFTAPCNNCSNCDREKPNLQWMQAGSKWCVDRDSKPAPKQNGVQIGGNHYITLSVQPWDAMAAWMSKEAFNGFLRGNVIKYIARDKGGIEDLKKARHYLDKLIEESNV